MAERKDCAELLALVVHEFRTPVTVVSGYLRMLLRDATGSLSERHRKLVEEAEKASGRLGSLVSQLSDLSNLDTDGLVMQRIDVPVFEIVAEVARGIEEGRDRGVALAVRGAESEATVTGDPTRLRSSFAALLHAAARERPGATELVADCEVRTRDGRRWGVVRIGDAGALGLLDSEEGQGPFDETRGGLGLVLPVARRVVEAHGGRLWSPRGDRRRAAIGVALPLKE